MPNFTVNITNASATSDGQAATMIIENENERRAALDPPETPLPLATNQELLASYETILAETLAKAHASYITQSADKASTTLSVKERWAASTDAQRDLAIAALASV